MNRTSPAYVRKVLAELSLRPSRRLGQNFLIDGNIGRAIVAAAEVTSRDVVLEIGPGLGALTDEILSRAGRVIAVEKDHRLVAYLETSFADCPKLELISGDMLQQDLAGMADAGVTKIVSNLPYASGTRILVEIVKSACLPARMVLTLQREVAQRLCAAVGDRHYGMLSVWVQRLYRARIERRVSATCFWPPPEVGSSVVVLDRDPDVNDVAQEELFYRLTSDAFAHRRKQMRAILSLINALDRDRAEGLLAELEINPTARPQNLSVHDWCRLANALA